MHHMFYGVCYLTITLCEAFEPSWGHYIQMTGHGTLAVVGFIAAAHAWTHAAAKRRKAKAAARDGDGTNVNTENASADAAD